MKKNTLFIRTESEEGILEERYRLGYERLEETVREKGFPVKEFDRYFRCMVDFQRLMTEVWKEMDSGAVCEASLEELAQRNRRLYEDILPDHYEESYANPSFATAKLGEDYGPLLSFLYVKLREMIPAAYDQDLFTMTIRMELFIEVYSFFWWEWEDTGKLPNKRKLRDIFYWYMSDYAETETNLRLKEKLCPEASLAFRIVRDCDLTDLRYLYYYGEYVTEEEIRTAKHMNRLSQEKLALLADTFTEGYCNGFKVCNKDITKKETVSIRYCLGFERMIRQAVLNFGNMGLKTILYRALQGVVRNGYYGAVPNRQYDYDHKDDEALFLDSPYKKRKLEALRAACESLKQEASLFGGPAFLEVFGEKPFVPAVKREAQQLSERQKKFSAQYRSAAGTLQNQYIKSEECSFTIMALPVPAIGEGYEAIFDETVTVNTLDNRRYQKIQQLLIDVLDQAAYVRVLGMGKNRTDLTVCLNPLKNPEKETNFENCTADVNIPLGEVFTSPRLAGTEGVLHVTRVFLGGLEYKDLSLAFKDGMVVDYSCENFPGKRENRKYIRENLLKNHPSLPMGEFAIGTNTRAYRVARQYGIADRLPILIAEKMGPHFAVGDTCYSHEEELISYNPDGKILVARQNEISALRNTDIRKAYYSCHTDITIPYDELGELSAVAKDGRAVAIIRSGRFVLPGCEELNGPLDELSRELI